MLVTIRNSQISRSDETLKAKKKHTHTLESGDFRKDVEKTWKNYYRFV